MLIIQRPEIEAVEAEGNTQSFMISPLEPGFGHTLGNSLRRTLLSSIPGAAVTQVRFDDALHEFDVIKGVKEDVTDVILNLKDLVLTCTSDEAGHAAPRQARSGRGARRRHPDDLRRRDPQPRALHRNGERVRSPRPRPHGRAGSRLPLGGAQQAHDHDRRHPRRRDLLAGAPGVVLDRPDACRAVDELRPPHARGRDRRFDLAARRARVGRRHAAQARRPGRRALRSSRVVWSSARSRRRPRPRPTSISRSRSSTCPSGRATASSGRASTRSASSCRSRRTTCSRSPTSAPSRSKKSSRSSTSAACRCASRSNRKSCLLRRRASASAEAPRTRS